MTALGQNHGTGLIAPPPVAPDKAVRIVPVSHMLHRVDGLQFADLTTAQQPLQHRIEGGIPENVAHDHHPAGLMSLLLELEALLQIRGNGLLQQDMIPLVQGLQRRRHMLAVLCGDKQHVRQLGLGQQSLVRGEALVLLHAVPLPQQSQAARTAVRPRHNLHLLRMKFLIGGIGLQAAAPAATNGKCNRHIVFLLPARSFPGPALSI